MQQDFEFAGKLWRYSSGKAAWYFITLPVEIAAEIKFFTAERRAAWGTVPVQAQIGTSIWQTSIFRASNVDSYLLPVKAAIRKSEKLQDDSEVKVHLRLI
jgi:hypothetical protein